MSDARHVVECRASEAFKILRRIAVIGHKVKKVKKVKKEAVEVQKAQTTEKEKKTRRK